MVDIIDDKCNNCQQRGEEDKERLVAMKNGVYRM